MEILKRTSVKEKKSYANDAEKTRLLSESFDKELMNLIERTLVDLGGDDTAVSVEELAKATDIRPKVLLDNLMSLQLRKKIQMTRAEHAKDMNDIYVKLRR